MAKIERRKNTGCFLQGIGLVSLMTGMATFWTGIGPIVFGVVGLWLLVYGGIKFKWYECSECGTRLAHKKLKTCPNCKSVFL